MAIMQLLAHMHCSPKLPHSLSDWRPPTKHQIWGLLKISPTKLTPCNRNYPLHVSSRAFGPAVLQEEKSANAIEVLNTKLQEQREKQAALKKALASANDIFAMHCKKEDQCVVCEPGLLGHMGVTKRMLPINMI